MVFEIFVNRGTGDRIRIQGKKLKEQDTFVIDSIPISRSA